MLSLFSLIILIVLDHIFKIKEDKQMNKIIAILFFASPFMMVSSFAESCEGNIISSCTTSYSGNVMCVDIINTSSSLSEIKGACESDLYSTFSIQPCSTINLTGSCSIYNKEEGYHHILRFYAPFPADHVSVVCAQTENGSVCE